jgi:hypothetical protein
MATRCVRLDQSPPKRLAPGAQFRSFKRIADRDVWARLMDQVEHLQNDGWRVRRVLVEFGKSRPLGAGKVLAWVADEVGCTGTCVTGETWTGRGKGATEVCLER